MIIIGELIFIQYILSKIFQHNILFWWETDAQQTQQKMQDIVTARVIIIEALLFWEYMYT